jgi:hypothetical protein
MLETLSPEDLFQHLLVFGSTGCGKTRYVILPLLAQVLGRDAGDPERRAGALIFDVKGDIPAHVEAVMKAAGRDDEIITIGRGGNAWFDPFVGIGNDSRAVAERLIEMVRGLHPESGGGSYDDFWRENNRRLLQVAAVVARARGLGDLGGIEGIAHAIEMICSIQSSDDAADADDDDDDGVAKQFVEIAERGKLISTPEAEMARQYLSGEIKNLARSTQACIHNYAKAYVSCLRDSRVAGILSPSGGHEFLPEDVIDRGRVVIVALSRVHFGPGAEVYRNMIKTAFQTCALQRYSRSHFDGASLRAINSTRPVYFVADEFPSFVTAGSGDDGDAFFLDKCREVKVGCILSAQGISALTGRMRSGSRAAHLLNNCCSKIFMATDCVETLGYFESAVPEGADKEEDVLYSKATAPSSFRLPNYEFGPPQQWVEKTKTASRSGGRKFAPAVLRQLKTGEGILLRPQGFAERMTFSPFKPPV